MPQSSEKIADLTFTSRYPMTTEQAVTIAFATVIPIVFGVFMATSSGKPTWWAAVALAPVAGWLTWRENNSRKKKAAVDVTVKNGVLTCKHVKSDPQSTKVDLSKVDYVTLTEISGKSYIIVAENDGHSDERVRIPVRAFTPGNPVGPVIKNAVEANGGTISAGASDYLTR